jgi:gamma-tubulin complex component 4
MMNMSTANGSGFYTFIRQKRGKGMEGDGEVRRHIERLLLRLDFNGDFSTFSTRRRTSAQTGEEILKGLE